jgi:hypothetical protein
MFPQLTYDFAKERIAAGHREAARHRFVREANQRAPQQSVRVAIELRLSACRDELERLAALSERRLRDGDWIVADVDGVPVAAVSIEDGTTVYDPFRPVSQAVSLLKLRRKQVLATA